MRKKLASRELTEYLYEKKNKQQQSNHYQASKIDFRCSLFFLSLIIWYWWCHTHGPYTGMYYEDGRLDGVQILIFHQYYRLVTALTLHQDAAHLSSNIVWGLLFLILLSKKYGYGTALFLTVLGGIMGNFIVLFLRPSGMASIGFSTAVFATIGTIAGSYTSAKNKKKEMFLSIMGALGLLGLLGMDGDNTDYISHFAGLASGLFLGITKNRVHFLNYSCQFVYFLLSFLIFCVAWLCVIPSHIN